jgi:hypothetical protein
MSRVENLRVKMGGTKCFMTFMVLDINGYNLLMGLDFLMKIGDVMDVGKGLIQIKNGLGLDVQILPPNTINVVYSLTSGDEFGITTMPMFIICEENESKIEEKIVVGFNDWEGCDRFELLSLHENVKTGEWQQLEQEARTRQ